MSDLFGLDRALTPQERRSITRKGPQPSGYARPPGTGPKGETCKTCAHLYRNELAKTYLKCSLTRALWTGGRKTDILARSPACVKWTVKETP